MAFSVCKSDYFIDRSREVFLACIAARKGKPGEDNFYSPGFLDVFILSTTALEAFMNERIAISLIWCNRRLSINPPDNQGTVQEDIRHVEILNKIKMKDLRTKYLKLPELLWHTTFDKNKSPFRDFNFLVDIRNDIIHYKMPFYDEDTVEPSWANELSSKGFFLSEPVVTPLLSIDEGRRVLVEEICTRYAAKWAHNTTCAMIKQFSKMSKGVIQSTIQSDVDDFSEYFAEV